VYVGTDRNIGLKTQYAGVLVVELIEDHGITCKKPDGGLTSWIDESELRRVDGRFYVETGYSGKVCAQE
jgi:hypothetical protein